MLWVNQMSGKLINCLKYRSGQDLKSSLGDSKSKTLLVTVSKWSTTWTYKEIIYIVEVLKRLR